MKPPFAEGRRVPVVCVLAGALFCAGCTVGPNYNRPAAPVPVKWEVTEPWREAEPKDGIPKTAWWTVFHDEELNALENDLLAANQSLNRSPQPPQRVRRAGGDSSVEDVSAECP